MRKTAHHKRPERRKRVRRVLLDRRATRCREPDQRRGPGRRRDDEESISVWEVASTSESLPGDRRLGSRRAAGVKVLAYDGVEMKKYRLRDISLDGAFLETKNFALTKGTNLEVVLKIRSGGKATYCRLPAMVIRAEEDGAAVMFAHLDEQADNTLLKIVKPFKQKPNAKVQDIRSNDQRFPRRV